MSRYTRQKKKKSYVDDGGAAKSSDRLQRRRRQKLMRQLKFPTLLCFCIYISYLAGHNKDTVKEKLIEKRKKANKTLRKFMHKHGRRPKEYEHEHEHEHEHEFEAKRERMRKKKAYEDSSDEETPASFQYRWATDRILPPITNQQAWAAEFFSGGDEKGLRNRKDFKVMYGRQRLPWEDEAENIPDRPPAVDYTKHDYEYPEIMPHPPRGGDYPAMETLGELLKRWPQNDLDSPPSPIVERLQHFDFNDPRQLKIAERYRNLEFPFKLTNVPELIAANEKWTDEYLTFHFDRLRSAYQNKGKFQKYEHIPKSDGKAQESVDSFFAFFTAKQWNVKKLGSPPTKDTDLTFAQWAKHARYADSVRLQQNETHYYWQSGASPTERDRPKDEWTMISVDLPSFSDPEPNFISFNPEESKGIQCRFGERGVAAATHYDGGRNMVGMITGAKRYVLAPPLECGKLGIVTAKKHPVFRHSYLNFDHINILDSEASDTMPELERSWLEIAKNSMAIETVLKAGEVLYIPSHWFHYIASLQKSAQCNVRSGREFEGSPEWGSSEDVLQCLDIEE